VNTEGAIQIENEETLATLGIQDGDKQNKSTTQYVLDTNIRKQTQLIRRLTYSTINETISSEMITIITSTTRKV
jgi:hypothetical protein